MLGVTFGRPDQWPGQDLIGYSDEFDPALVLEGYRCGVFPMPLSPDARSMGWWSPVLRGLLPVHGLHVTRSVRKSAKRYVTTVDEAFDEVIAACADPSRPHGWIDDRVVDVYRTLHRGGWAHSVETWNEEGRLVGGLYGVHLGGMFAGESMFHDAQWGRDASKVALVRLALELALVDVRLLDVQWLTEHLGTLGAYEVPREEYLRRLDRALARPGLKWRRHGRLRGDELIAAWSRIASDGSVASRGNPDA